MASLRPSTASAAARLLRRATIAPRSSILPASRRFESSTSSPDSTAVSSKQPKAEDLAPVQRNAPDYDVPVDQATSMFTPVPKTIQDGSEENLPLPAGLLSGAPLELQARTVRIYQPSKPATQSGTAKGSRWRMDWDVLGKGHRWENPLMGWQSSADSMQGTHLAFQSKEDAIAFAEKQGYEYFVQEPNTRAFTPKAYANNFLYSPGKLKMVRTK
ncbi:ETC complex I subunit conserved region-domain-containing protein [Triangularia verruculosa]|uniref:NADH dehydrogenase [ubiquinone] iron-sulfur protein 4, mitochondrial n=1 Tax=Triangularia verruculosa TaxID=2587418 RepID=A0AAN7AZD9_9PEZI|nr:ETC complex I subunit conserved region-domain-containing protein [Triangularia verruculosa]